MIKVQMTKVQLTSLAIKRWNEFRGKTAPREIQKIVAKHLFNKLKCGIRIDQKGVGRVQIYSDMWALVQVTGFGWKVVTFHRGEKLKC